MQDGQRGGYNMHSLSMEQLNLAAHVSQHQGLDYPQKSLYFSFLLLARPSPSAPELVEYKCLTSMSRDIFPAKSKQTSKQIHLMI
jgi:hypothetical protein